MTTNGLKYVRLLAHILGSLHPRRQISPRYMPCPVSWVLNQTAHAQIPNPQTRFKLGMLPFTSARLLVVIWIANSLTLLIT